MVKSEKGEFTTEYALYLCACIYVHVSVRIRARVHVCMRVHVPAYACARVSARKQAALKYQCRTLHSSHIILLFQWIVHQRRAKKGQASSSIEFCIADTLIHDQHQLHPCHYAIIQTAIAALAAPVSLKSVQATGT